MTADAARGDAQRVPAATLGTWLVRLDGDADLVERAASTLTPAERARVQRGTAAVRRRRILLRAAVRQALGGALGLPPARVPLGTSGAGRPEVLHRDDVDVSCSAAGRIGLVAVTQGARVGVDVEAVAPWSSDVLVEGWLTTPERRALLRLPAEARAIALTRCWTQKEALLKGRGTGLAGDPATVPTRVGTVDTEVAGWHVREVEVPTGWVASVATTPRLGPRSSAGGVEVVVPAALSWGEGAG